MYSNFNIDNKIISMVNDAESALNNEFKLLEKIYENNQLKVLNSFIKNGLSESHLIETTGYGYNDQGRDIIDKIFSDIFNTEAAFVRPIFASGTHTIITAIKALTEEGKEILSINGDPYDTIKGIIKYKKVDLINNCEFDKNKIKDILQNNNISLILIQRSKGYEMRKSFSYDDLKDIISFIKNINDEVIIFVDNCYGEFADTKEPSDAGADIVVGSLIKNIGGGIARSGGYVVGKKYLIEKVADRLYCDGMGREIGINFNQNRHILQGLFMAPQVVKEAIKGAKLFSKIYSDLGYKVNPNYNEQFNDIVVAIELNDENKLTNFCKAIQEVSAIDSFVRPTPSEMPGYDNKVIMASGNFISGSTIELSCDGTFIEPYNVYVQGGLSYYQIKIAVMKTLSHIL